MTLEQKIDEIEQRVRVEATKISFHDYHERIHSACGDEITEDGMWLEFGVFCGRSIEQFSRKTKNDIYGFDCFEGLPEKWDDQNPQKSFNLGGKVPAGYIVGDNHSMFNPNLPTNVLPWPANVKLVPGYFDATLPKFLEQYDGDVAFLHIGSDLYSSAKTVLDLLKSRIKRGTIILFDELMDYGAYREHEIKAFAEFLLDTGFDYTPLYYSNMDYSCACFRLK